VSSVISSILEGKPLGVSLSPNLRNTSIFPNRSISWLQVGHLSFGTSSSSSFTACFNCCFLFNKTDFKASITVFVKDMTTRHNGSEIAVLTAHAVQTNDTLVLMLIALCLFVGRRLFFFTHHLTAVFLRSLAHSALSQSFQSCQHFDYGVRVSFLIARRVDLWFGVLNRGAKTCGELPAKGDFARRLPRFFWIFYNGTMLAGV